MMFLHNLATVLVVGGLAACPVTLLWLFHRADEHDRSRSNHPTRKG